MERSVNGEKIYGEEYIVRGLCLQIRKNVDPSEWKKYEEQTRDSGRIQLFLQHKEIQSCVYKHLKLHPGSKDKERAMALKVAGNKAFGLGDNERALHLYSQSLVWMPHDETKDVSVVYANRSAALFGLEEYLLAKKDAELAFTLNYPEELHYKLLERVGRCCLQLREEVEAKKAFRGAVKALEFAKLEEQKLKKMKKVLEELIRYPPSMSHGFHQNQGETAGKELCTTLPNITGGRNKYLKAGSSRLTLQYREKQGRFVIANEAFRPGDVILVEKAYVSVLNAEQYHRQCFQCYSPLKNPVVCPQCIFVSFCSTECQEKAQKTHHQYECSILGLLKNSGISVICYMALRILTQEDPKTVLGWYELAVETEEEEISQNPEKASEELSNNCKDKKKTLETLGFNEEYHTEDHANLFHLVTHSTKRRKEELLHQIVMSLYILEALKTTSYFDGFKTKLEKGENNSVQRGGKSDKKQEASSAPKGKQQKNRAKNGNAESLDDAEQASIPQNGLPCQETIPLDVQLKFAVLFLRLLKSLQFNTHELAGWDENKEKDNSVGLGGALFPTLALFNHSCNPSIVRYFVNDTVVVRAIRTIVPGEIVTETYCANYSVATRQERQARLLDCYWFQCDCIVCREDWPTFDKLTSDVMKFRCTYCGTFICKADENMGILFTCGKCKKPVNILKSLKSITESEKKYKQGVEFISKGQLDLGLGVLLENLFTIESLLIPPFREYHMCQEYIRRCYLAVGNRMSNLPAWDPEQIMD